MITVFDVAAWFIHKSPMTHKKLQKLCYYAQSWHLAMYDKVLFDGKFEAWAHGPVCRKLWNAYKDYKYVEITDSDIVSGDSSFETETEEFLERVWLTYGEYSGSQLEQLTHSEKPWINARGGIPDFHICTNQISENDMKYYYNSIYSGDGNGE